MWLKNSYGIYINPQEKAFIYSIHKKNGKLVSSDFQIIPIGIAAVLKLLGEGYEISTVTQELVSKGMEFQKARRLVENIAQKYEYLFTNDPVDKIYSKEQIDELISQYGRKGFDYKNRKYYVPKNVIIESSNDDGSYMEYNIAEKIHRNCIEEGIENIFYVGNDVCNWKELSFFIIENKKYHIRSVMNIDLSEDTSKLKEIVECGIDHLQIFCKEINECTLNKMQDIFEYGISFDLILMEGVEHDLEKVSLGQYLYKIRNIYLYGESIKGYEKIIKYLEQFEVQPIVIWGCRNTLFGERSCFKSGVMNLIFTSSGNAVFCIRGGRNIVFGNIKNDSLSDIWNRIDTSIENRKRMFSHCNINNKTK